MHNAADRRPQNGVSLDRDDSDRNPGRQDSGSTGGVADAVTDGIAAATAMVRLAEAIAAAGGAVDLAGLDDRMGRLCAQALDLPPAQGAELRAGLTALLRDLDTLAVTLRRE